MLDSIERSDSLRNAKNFGLPQNRLRVYLVGFDNKRYGEKLKEIKFRQLPRKRSRKAFYNDLILVIDEDKSFYLAQSYVDSLKSINQNKALKVMDLIM